MAAGRGDAEAWAGLVDRFQDSAVAVSVGILADPVAAQDAAQESFVPAKVHLRDLHDPACGS